LWVVGRGGWWVVGGWVVVGGGGCWVLGLGSRWVVGGGGWWVVVGRVPRWIVVRGARCGAGRWVVHAHHDPRPTTTHHPPPTTTHHHPPPTTHRDPRPSTHHYPPPTHSLWGHTAFSLGLRPLPFRVTRLLFKSGNAGNAGRTRGGGPVLSAMAHYI